MFTARHSSTNLESSAAKNAYLRILALLDILQPATQQNLPIHMRLPRQGQALVREEARALRYRDLQLDKIDAAQAAERIVFTRTPRVLDQLVIVLLTIRDSSQRDRRARFLRGGVTHEITRR